MPPKRKATLDVAVPLWSVSALAEFLRSNSELPQASFRKQKFFEMLSGHALALLQAFLEVKSVEARQWFMRTPWPEKQDNTLIPATTRWLDKVKWYITMANASVGRSNSAINNFLHPSNETVRDPVILGGLSGARGGPHQALDDPTYPGFDTDRPIGRGSGHLGDLT